MFFKSVNKVNISKYSIFALAGMKFSQILIGLISLTILTSIQVVGQNVFTDSGYVGIGTLRPRAPLHISGSGNQWIGISSTDSVNSYTRLMSVSSNHRTESQLQFKNQFHFVAPLNGNDAIMTLLENRKVGIGTDNPQTKLHVNGTTTTNQLNTNILNTQALRVNGRLGIGTSQPTAHLDITGENDQWINLSSTAQGSQTRLMAVSSNNRIESQLQFKNQLLFVAPVPGNAIMAIRESGKVGIGTITPSSRLHITHTSDSSLTGTSAFGGLHLEQTGGADRFVGITTDALSHPNTTQGGMLIQGSGQYGTKIHFLTTDRYVDGMKQRMIIDHKGNVGVGTTTPFTRLHIPHTSGASLTGTSAFGGIHLEQTGDADKFVGITTDALGHPNTTQGGMLIQGSGRYGTKIHFLTTDKYVDGMKQRMIIDHRGNVGIGTTEVPSIYKMAVDGKIICEELRVEMSESWPDYVFGEDYSLMPLSDLAKHIEEEKHLPGIPSAQEIESEGVAVGEMQRLLMEKIEELTLYIIQQQKEIESLKTQTYK